MNPQPSGGEPELRAELLAEREVLNTRLVNLETRRGCEGDLGGVA